MPSLACFLEKLPKEQRVFTIFGDLVTWATIYKCTALLSSSLCSMFLMFFYMLLAEQINECMNERISVATYRLPSELGSKEHSASRVLNSMDSL